MINIQNLFSEKTHNSGKNTFIFSCMDDDSDYWNSESPHFHTDSDILDLIEKKHFDIGLEVGAGNGRATEPFSQICGHLVALESSKVALRELKKRKLKDITYVLSFNTKLPFKDKQFDFVGSVTVIEHIPPESCVEFLEEHYRVLKPGGTLFIRNDAWFYGVLEHLGYFDKAAPDPTHVNMMTPKQLKHILVKVGFTIERADYFPFCRYTNLKLPFMDVFATKGNFICKKPL